MSEAVERARLRREEEEQKMSASQKVREKLKQAEQLISMRRKGDSTSSNKVRARIQITEQKVVPLKRYSTQRS